jgi:hypothetical protein
MAKQLCQLVDHDYRRRKPPVSNTWELAVKIIIEDPRESDAGFIQEMPMAGYYCVTYAIHCSRNGEIDETIKGLYGALADARFKHRYPDALLS